MLVFLATWCLYLLSGYLGLRKVEIRKMKMYRLAQKGNHRQMQVHYLYHSTYIVPIQFFKLGLTVL